MPLKLGESATVTRERKREIRVGEGENEFLYERGRWALSRLYLMGYIVHFSFRAVLVPRLWPRPGPTIGLGRPEALFSSYSAVLGSCLLGLGLVPPNGPSPYGHLSITTLPPSSENQKRLKRVCIMIVVTE
jgi:hypothetical protein